MHHAPLMCACRMLCCCQICSSESASFVRMADANGAVQPGASTTDGNNTDGAIPIVVQKALGMQNLQLLGGTPRNDVICGLEGQLLPRYLSLRAGLRVGNSGKNAKGSLPGELLRAQEEERRSRRRNHNRGTRSRGASRPRKRSRKSDHKSLDPSEESGGDVGDAMPVDDENAKGRRRRKRRRRGSKASAGSSNCNDDWIQYQTMARIIVAPYTSSAIRAFDRCRQQIEEHLLQSEEGDELETESYSALETQPDALEAAAEPSASASTKEPSSSVQNVYLKTKSNSSSGGFLVLSRPRESLQSIVDGAIDVLVRRTHRYRSNARRKENRSAVGKNGKREIPRRRRMRRGGQLKAPVSGASSASSDDKRGDPSTNDWLLEQNLLSAGYTLGSGDTLASFSDVKGSQRDRVLRGCPTMAPGVHCVHPNSLASHARSSSLMKLLHKAVGDDVLREMLVNCIVLVPAVSEGALSSMFERGNYFQLCGPPLNVLARKFDGMGAELKAINAKGGRKRAREAKRGDSVPEKKLVAGDGRGFGNEKYPSSAEGGGTSSTSPDVDSRKKRWDPNKPIPRGNLFYCDFYARDIGLSPRHLLNQPERCAKSASPNSDVNVKLLNSMVHLWPSARDVSNANGGGACTFSRNKRRGRWRRLREDGVAMCRELRRRHQRCYYGRLLERHCPLPSNMMTHSSAKDSNIADAKVALAHHVTMHTPAKDVGSFLEAVLGTAFPVAFWGSAHNFRRVVQTMRVFAELGRAEQLPEKATVEGIRVLDMTWLLPRSRDTLAAKDDDRGRHRTRRLSRPDHESATHLVRNVMRWLYVRFIIPLLRSTFYVTETEFTGNRVLYYRRPIWERIRHLSMKTLLKQQYREIDARKAQKVLSIHNVGCPPAPLRLLPKKTGIRAIAMLSKTCQDERISVGASATGKEGLDQTSASPPNKILQSTFHALKYEHEKKPSLFGAGVLGLTEVFPPFCLFVEALKKKRSSFGPSSTDVPIYFASADIQHCYDTINQKRLFKLLKSVVEEDVYLTKNNFVLHTKDRNGSLRCQWKKSTFAPDQFSRFLATSHGFAEKYFQSIFVDGVRCSAEKKATIIGLLRDHIFGQLIVPGGGSGQRYLLQKDGIPQGSILSSMCCNVYFGDVEGFMLSDVFDDASHVISGSSSAQCDVLLAQSQNDLHLLVRIVDDFLLISTNKATSSRFLAKLNKGVPSLGVKINSDKSRVNYPLELRNADTGAMETVSTCQSELFPWCGLLVDTRTCEISLDYERFSRPQATGAVVIHRSGSEGLNLKKKMKDFVRPRCSQKLLFSSHINGIDTIRLNFYQTFVLCAVKTRHYIQNGAGTSSLTHQQRFVYDSACDTIQFAFLLISSKIKHGKAPSIASSTFELPWDDALWLGRHAFFSVFRKGGKPCAELCKMFSESSRASNRTDLLAVSRRALTSFPLDCA
ncbi:hypothetical protein ACHAXT_011807 [Thalassiosira profunda]